MLGRFVFVFAAAASRELKHRSGRAVHKQHTATPPRSDAPVPAPGECGPMPSNATSRTLAELLERYADVQAEQRAKPKVSGKSITVIATRHGLGNRINNVVGGFALALATNRALVVHWPRTDCRRKREDCDPTSIDDLFDPPPGVSWGRIKNWPKATATMCSHGPFVISNNRFSDVEAVLDMNLSEERFNGPDKPKNWCAISDRSWAHAVSCNPLLRCAAPTPWFFYGLLQRWLLRPKRAVLERVKHTLGRGKTCAVGVHLRKADLSSTKWATEELLAEAYATALERRGRARGDPTFGVYIASDGESRKTRLRLEQIARDVDAPLLARAVTTRPTRGSIRGNQDALAENYVLASCDEILPRGSGASTFHDLAVARAAFDRGWNQSRVDAFTYHPDKSDHSLVPARCPKRKGAELSCPCATGATSWRDLDAPWPGPAVVSYS